MATYKDLIKLFYEYQYDSFLYVGQDGNIEGLISYKDSLSDIDERQTLESDLQSRLDELIYIPTTSEMKDIIIKFFNCKESFPVIHYDGSIQIINADELEKIINKFSLSKFSYKDILNGLQIPVLYFSETGTIIFENFSFLNIKEQVEDSYLTDFIDALIKMAILEDFDGFQFVVRDKNDEIIQEYKVKTTLFCVENDTSYFASLFIPIVKEIKIEEKVKVKQFSNIEEEIENLIKEDNFSLSEYLENIESKIILKVMKILENNVSLSAKVLHIPRQTLQYKLKKIKKNP